MLEDISLKLLIGKPIDIGIAKVYALKIDDIIELGENKYNQYLNLLLFDVDLLEFSEEQLKEIDIDKITTYHYLVTQSFYDEEVKDIIVKAFECFFKEKVIFDKENGLFCIEYENNIYKQIRLDEYNLFRKVLIKQNFLKELEEEEELIFGNALAKQWYLELKRKDKTQPKLKSNVNLQSIISSVMWKTHKSVDEILKMTIYQLYDGYFRLSLIDSCNNLAQGIYHGTVDQTKVKQSELNWAKILKFNTET